MVIPSGGPAFKDPEGATPRPGHSNQRGLSVGVLLHPHPFGEVAFRLRVRQAEALCRHGCRHDWLSERGARSGGHC